MSIEIDLSSNDLGDLDRDGFDREAIDSDNDELDSLSEQSELIEENAELFNGPADGLAPGNVAQGELAVIQANNAFVAVDVQPALEAVNPGDGNGGVNNDGPNAAPDGGDAPPPAGGGGGGEPPPPNVPLATEPTLEAVRALLAEMQASAVERGDADRASENAYRETSLLYEKANIALSSLSTAATVGGVFFAVIAYLVDRFSKEQPHAHATAGAASASPIASWVSQLPPPMRQAIVTLGDQWSQLDELEPFTRVSNFARKHAKHLAVYQHIQLLQLIRVVGSHRDQRFIWYESEKFAYVRAAADVLNRQGYPALYAFLSKASMNGRALPVTVAAYCGQLAIAWVFASQKQAGAPC
jgi:hypothetical protein